MTVNQLNATLMQLLSLLQAADAKKGTIDGLNEFIECTASFGEMKIKEFVKFAEAGRSPAAEKLPRSGGKQTVDAQSVIQSLKNLYDRAAEPAVDETQIKSECAKLDALKKNDLASLAEGIGLSGMKSKSKAEIISIIFHRILERNGAAVRSKLIDRPQIEGMTEQEKEQAG
jgi:hypothetical protein